MEKQNCKAWKIIRSHWLIKELEKQGFVIIHKSKLQEIRNIAGKD